MTHRILRQILYDELSNWEYEYVRKIKFDEEYFNKLKFLLKGDISDDKFVRIDHENGNIIVFFDKK